MSRYFEIFGHENQPKRDTYMLLELSDEELEQICHVSQYVEWLCETEDLWEQKIIQKYPNLNLEKIIKLKTYLEIPINAIPIKSLPYIYRIKKIPSNKILYEYLREHIRELPESML